jgi:putative ABC transport system substrate-binding protein
MSDMRRREFMALVGGTAAWPLAARAQQPMPVIGFLGILSPDLYEVRLRAFHQGLKETNYVEGQNVEIEYRWAEGQNSRLPMLATELVHHRVSVIAASGTAAAVAAKAATTTIPIVFGTAADPVEVGLVASLNRPGGNLTGVTNLNAEIGPKRLELLHAVVPRATIIALLVNPTIPTIAEPLSRDLQAAADTLGLKLQVLHASTEGDFDTVFASLVKLQTGALVIGPDTFFTARSKQLGALSVRHAMPTIFQYREFAAAGGLMSYGGSNAEYYRLIGVYTGKILKGEKPDDLPIQRSTKIEFIINLKTARALGLTLPLDLLGLADEVIE